MQLHCDKVDEAFIVIGDFSIDLLIEDSHSSELIDVMREFNLELSSPLEAMKELIMPIVP